MINSLNDIINFVKDKYYKKIFLLCGKKSFDTSGANIILEDLSIKKTIGISKLGIIVLYCIPPFTFKV